MHSPLSIHSSVCQSACLSPVLTKQQNIYITCTPYFQHEGGGWGAVGGGVDKNFRKNICFRGSENVDFEGAVLLWGSMFPGGFENFWGKLKIAWPQKTATLICIKSGQYALRRVFLLSLIYCKYYCFFNIAYQTLPV